jgi:transcriptional regulator with XRE-family HTH domain
MDIETIRNVDIDPAKLKAARGDRSPSEVAKLFGIERQHLWAIENGSRKPSAPLLIRLCLFYGVGLKDIISAEKFLRAA